MFVQHHSTASSAPSTSIVKKSEDFELSILTKSSTKITGTLQFQYLNQSFNAHIVITPTTIQINAQQAFEGIFASAPIIPNAELATKNYLSNGTITQTGNQNIVWLILDFIHLYNLLRCKPSSILEIYREAFLQIKLVDAGVIFGKIDAEGPYANQMNSLLSQKLKRKYKYIIANAADLLANFQYIIANYPLQLSKQTKAKQVEPILN
jgi:hypothetical protein